MRTFIYVAILGLSLTYTFRALTGESREQAATAVQIGRINDIDEAHATLTIDGVELSNDRSGALQVRNGIHVTAQTSILYGATTIRFADLRPGDLIRVCSISRGKERKALEIQKYGRTTRTNTSLPRSKRQLESGLDLAGRVHLL
jgi:hypothetical protein